MVGRGRKRGSGWSMDKAKRAQLRRAGETDEERAKRLSDQRERQRNRRNNETEEERAERLRKQNIRIKARRLQRCDRSADVGQMNELCPHCPSYLFHVSAISDQMEETPEQRRLRLKRHSARKRRAKLKLIREAKYDRIIHAATKLTKTQKTALGSDNNRESMIGQQENTYRRPEDVKRLLTPKINSATTICYLTQKSIDRLFEISKCIQNIKEMCNDIDFRGFVATYTLANVIKSSLFTEQTENRLLLHTSDCFLVNKQGKIGCGLYRVLMDVLGETVLVHLGLHTRTLRNILMDFINCGGVKIKGEANVQLLLFIFTRFVLKL